MRVLVIYFSGCGYTAWAAQKVADTLAKQGNDVAGVLDIEHYAPAEQEQSERHIFLMPTYFFSPPALIVKALRKIPMVADKEAVVIATNAAQQGATTLYVSHLLKARGYKVFGTAEMILPDTFLATQQKPEERLERLKKAEDSLQDLCKKIVGTEAFSCDRNRAYGIITVFVLSIFRRVWGLALISTKDCSHCGMCEHICPMHNIRMQGGRPVFGANCTGCFRCVNRCPAKAIDMSAVSWVLGACGAVVGLAVTRWILMMIFGAFLGTLLSLFGVAYGFIGGVFVGQKIYRKIAQVTLFSKRDRVPCDYLKKGC